MDSAFGLRPSDFIRVVRRWALLALLLHGTAASAQTTNLVTLGSNLPNAGLSLLRVIGSLALVLALFFAGVWLFKNWQRVAVNAGRAPKLQVLETRHLGSRQALYVVGYEHQRFLVASSPAGMSLLTRLPEADASEEAPAGSRPTFADALHRVLVPGA
jgi:flagellar biogenesis protein FliO